MGHLSFASAQDLRWAVLVQIFYIFVYYGFIIVVGYHKMRLWPDAIQAIRRERQEQAEKRQGQSDDIDLDMPQGPIFAHSARQANLIKNNPDFMRADRSQLNMLEQMPPFLVCFWLYCLLVDAQVGAIMGAIYTVQRAFYYALHANWWMPWVVTFPNYAIIAYLGLHVLVVTLIACADSDH